MQNFGVDFLDGTHFHFGRHFGGLQTHSSLTDGQLEALLERAFQDMRTLAIQHENGAWMEVEFGEKGCFMVFSEQDGEVIRYFDNGSGNHGVVDLLINCCPEERLMCYSKETLMQVIETFLKTGRQDGRFHWIDDEALMA